MDPDRKKAILEKRSQLKKANEESKRLNLIEDFLNYLRGLDIEFSIDFSSLAWNWMEETLPLKDWGMIDWSRVSIKHALAIEKIEKTSKACEEMYDFLKVKNEKVTIVWSNAERPEVTVNAHRIPPLIDELTDVDFDFWLVPESRIWCIEYHHSGSFSGARLELVE